MNYSRWHASPGQTPPLSKRSVICHDIPIPITRHAVMNRPPPISQGDPGNTAKIVETLALGGAGGCIPVFVLYTADTDAAPGRHPTPLGVPCIIYFSSEQYGPFAPPPLHVPPLSTPLVSAPAAISTIHTTGIWCCIYLSLPHPKSGPSAFLRDYPHTDWLDYCHVSYFVTKHVQ